MPSLALAEISSITPDSLPVGSVEQTITIRGTSLTGVVPDDEGKPMFASVVTFTGAATGVISTLSNSAAPDGTSLVVYVPGEVAVNVGVYAIDVYATTDGETTHSGPATFTISPPDVTNPPVLFVPEVQYAEATSSRGANVEYEASAQSADGLLTYPVSCSPPSGSFFTLGSHNVTCSASNEFGTSTARFTVVVGDTTPPTLTLPADISSTTAVVTYTVTGADNLGGPVDIQCSPASGSTFPTGTSTVSCVGTDESSNTGYGTFNVTVTHGLPVLHLPDDTIYVPTTSGSAVVSYTATATDGTIVCTPPSGSTFTIGSTIVNCTATNDIGSVSGSFEIVVVDFVGDVTPPVLHLPADITAEATSASGAAVTFTATATDDVDGNVAVVCVPPSGSTFAIGVTTVNCSATDASGNRANGSFKVTVADTTPPTVTSVTPSPGSLWPPNHKMTAVTVTVNATDAVDPAPVSTITSVTSNQPTEGTGDGDVAVDWEITGALTVNLRSERSSGKDRTYTITVKTTDLYGNSTISTVDVKVTQQSNNK